MNVLVIVFTILMLLSIMTYARLQQFLTFSGIRIAYEKYMTENERKYANETERKLYASARVKVAKAKGEDVPEEDLYDDEEEEESPYTPPGPGQATPLTKPIRKLNLQPLLKGGAQGADNPLALPTAQILYRLIDQIYSKQNFYKEALAKNPDLVGQIVSTFVALKDKKVCDAPVSALKDLAKVNFPSLTARDAFGKMLDGGEGIPQLGEYVVIRSKDSPIRMMGAADELLLAIYRDPNVVEALKRSRLELYQAVKSGRMKPDEAAKAFSSQFGGEHATEIDPKLLDFTVSTTTPGK